MSRSTYLSKIDEIVSCSNRVCTLGTAGDVYGPLSRIALGRLFGFDTGSEERSHEERPESKRGQCAIGSVGT